MSGFFVELRKDIYYIEYLSTLGLNDRQLDALLYYKEKGEIISSDYMKRYDITDRTTLRDLTELVEKKILIKTGEIKSTKYWYTHRNVE